ncbi:MAG: heme-copper oxidase subunit III [Candidatus Acidiferrales bacterium]
MAPTITEHIDLIVAGHGGGPGLPAGGGDGDRPGDSRRVPQRAYFTLVQLLLAAIVMFFMALTSSYIVRKGLGTDWQQTPLPPILWFNTVILLGSSLTIHLARRRERAAFRQWWGLTIVLGLAFLGGQLAAWKQLSAAGMFLDTNPSSSFFYLLTAAHGLHLAGGIFFLFYVVFRNWRRSQITQETAADLAAIYWHFMDGLWLFLFALLTLGR